MNAVEAHRPLQELACEGRIVGVSWGEQKEEGQAGAAAEQGMHAIATQQRARMLGWGMSEGRIRVGPSPRKARERYR